MKFTKIIGLIGLASIGSSFEANASVVDLNVCRNFCEGMRTYCGTLKTNKDDCTNAIPVYINPGCADVDACKAAATAATADKPAETATPQ